MPKRSDSFESINNLSSLRSTSEFGGSWEEISNLTKNDRWSRSIDFKNDHTFAKLWGEISYKKWLNHLDSHKKSSLWEYTSNSTFINAFLRTYGDLPSNESIRTSPEMWEQRDKIANIENIDQALKNNFLKSSVNVYRITDLAQFYTHQECKDIFGKLRSEIKVDDDLKERLEQDFKHLVYFEPSFVSTSLSENPPGMKDVIENPLFNKSVLLKINLPKGSNVAYIGEISAYKNQNEVLVARKQWYEYKNFSIINIQGKPILKVEVELNPEAKFGSCAINA